jgi:corrinoid protein of di/trimethylamine methyltransferase
VTDFPAGVRDAVVRGDKEDTLSQVKKANEAGIEPARIIADGLTAGLYVVGEKFESGEYFLPDMMMAAEAMAAALAYLEPYIKESKKGETRSGRMVIGTVKGDLHSIGKNIVIMMMKSAGFEVFDLGVDVSTSAFIAAVRENEADILGISALMTTTIQEQKRIIEMLKENGLRDQVKVLVGGAPLSEEWARKVGADGYAPDAIAAVKKAKSLLGLL